MNGKFFVKENAKVKNAAFPTAHTPAFDWIHKPCPIDVLAYFSTQFAYQAKETAFDLVG